MLQGFGLPWCRPNVPLFRSCLVISEVYVIETDPPELRDSVWLRLCRGMCDAHSYSASPSFPSILGGSCDF